MNRFFCGLNLLAMTGCLIAAIGLPSYAEEEASSSVDDNTLYWHTNLEEARAEAKATGMPMFLEFRCAP